MFETTEVILSMTGIYLVVGFALGVLYNIFRFCRKLFPRAKMLSAVLDLIFTVLSGIVLFIFSAAYGRGYFRLYYVAAAAIGFAANMLTLGFIVPPLARLFRRVFCRLSRCVSGYITKIISFIRQKATVVFIKIGEKLTKIAKKCKIHLKKYNKMVYNNNDHKIGKVYGKGGETGNAIKAKVRKVG